MSKRPRIEEPIDLPAWLGGCPVDKTAVRAFLDWLTAEEYTIARASETHAGWTHPASFQLEYRDYEDADMACRDCLPRCTSCETPFLPRYKKTVCMSCVDEEDKKRGTKISINGQ